MLYLCRWLSLLLFVVATMGAIGLQVTLPDLVAVHGRKVLLIRSVFINFLAIPALGWLATRLVPMERTSADAILILAYTPGGISAVQFTSKRREVLAFAGQTAFLLTGLSIFLSPLLMSISLPADLHLVVPYAKAFWFFFCFMLLPLGVGALVRTRADYLAKRLGRPIALIGSVAFVAFVLLTLSTRQAAIAALDRTGVEAMLGFIVATMVIGWLGGGPEWEGRAVLASASSMRNVALALVIVIRSFPDAGIDVPLIAFSALMIPPNLIFLVGTLALQRYRRRATKSENTRS
jgi:bile acid:Na+ symporter, BASS family